MRTVVLFLALVPSAAWADAPSWALGVEGPGPGLGRVAIGGGLVEASGVGPSLAVDYVRGLSSALDLYGSGEVGLLSPGGEAGLLSILGVGVQLRATAPGADLDFALRGGPEVVLFHVDGDLGYGGVVLGVAPGFAVGMGTDTVQVTVGVDVPLYLYGAFGAASRTASGADLSVTVRPSISVEGRLGGDFGWFATATHHRLLSGPGGGGAILSTGAQVGLTF